MTTQSETPREPVEPRAVRGLGLRKGSALILVLIMTLSLAGLAISAILLSSSAGLLTRFYDRERDYRYAAEAALALGLSRVENDTLLSLPEDTAMALLSGASLTDASGNTIPRIKVNLYAAYTGDTTGTYGQFVTLLAQAYDSGGTRYVRRLDLVAESFAKYAMFTNLSPSNYQYGPGEFLKGRGHSNGDWKSTGGGPGPHYYDTITATGSVSGASGNAIYDKGYISGYKKIPYPTIPKLASMQPMAAAANLDITPVSATSGGATQGTWMQFVPIDINSDGTYDATEGFFRLFDMASGMDTTRLRADIGTASSNNSLSAYSTVTPTIMNQCGETYTIGGKKEFFPIAAHQWAWVTTLIQTSTSPTVTSSNASKMADLSSSKFSTAVDLIMGQPNARCYEAGDPHLMLTERFTDALGVWHKDGSTTTSDTVPFGQIAAQQYGGQDTTFSEVVRDCATLTSLMRCTGGKANVKYLGGWRAWPGTALSAWPASTSTGLTPRQANEKAYEWPMTAPYNANSKGVIHVYGPKIYMSGVFRGNVTVYEDSNVTFMDDLTYDQDPAAPSALCRNMLGIIFGDSAMLADNPINRPRTVDWGGTKIQKILGPNEDFYLHAILMSLRGTVTTENAGGNLAQYPTAISCPTGDTTGTTGTSGGCWFQTGGTIETIISQHYTSSANSGLREGRTLDPCQLTNKKPAFFPNSMQYQVNKYYEIDPVNVSTWAQVKQYYAYLRGKPAP